MFLILYSVGLICTLKVRFFQSAGFYVQTVMSHYVGFAEMQKR